jgi:hypothetical protein
MADELLVAGVVRTLAEYAFRDDPRLVAEAVAKAVDAHLSGASVPEACRVGQLFISRHRPSDAAVPADLPVADLLASSAA